MRRVYRGRDIEVSFDLDICTLAAECLLGLPGVFELRRRPWVLPDAAAADAVAAVIERCPSGALLYKRLDGGPQEEAPATTTISPLLNGPLLVRGRVEVRHANGLVEQLPRAMLCRCGLSKNKPFCDNSHLAARFQASGERLRIRLSPVRPVLEKPISKADDPRRD